MLSNKVTYIVVVTAALLSVSISASRCQSEPQGKLVSMDNHLTAGAQFITSLSAVQLAALACGQPVKLDDLSAEQKTKIMNAAKTAVGDRRYDSMFGILPSGTQWTLVLYTGFVLSFESAKIGPKHIPVPLYRFLPKLGLTPAYDSAAVPPQIPALPELSAFMSDVSTTDLGARVVALRTKVPGLLKPVAAYRLSRVDDMPFALADFESAKRYPLTEMNDKQRAWVSQLYGQFCSRAVLLRKKHPNLRVTAGSATLEGVSAEWIKKDLPLWSTMDDVAVNLNLEYTLGLAPVGTTACNLGGGWMLPSQQ